LAQRLSRIDALGDDHVDDLASAGDQLGKRHRRVVREGAGWVAFRPRVLTAPPSIDSENRTSFISAATDAAVYL
jgi:hypothetical protein